MSRVDVFRDKRIANENLGGFFRLDSTEINKPFMHGKTVIGAK